MEVSDIESLYKHVDMSAVKDGNSPSRVFEEAFRDTIVRYVQSDYNGHIELDKTSNKRLNDSFNDGMKGYEDSIIAEGVMRMIDTGLIRNRFEALLQTNRIKKKIRFEYHSSYRRLAEAYSRFINDTFNKVAINYPRVTDNYYDKSKLVYDVYLQLRAAKFVCAYFPFLVDRRVGNVFNYVQTNQHMSPYFHAFAQRSLAPEIVFDLFTRGQLPDVQAEFKNQGNIWNIALFDTAKERNKRLQYLIDYEIFMDFISKHVMETIRQDPPKDTSEIDRQLKTLSYDLIDPYLETEDDQMSRVIQLFNRGAFKITRECEKRIDFLEGKMVSEWEIGELEFDKTQSILDDFTETVVVINDNVVVSDTFYTSNVFGFLYLGSPQTVRLGNKGFSCVGNYMVFHSYVNFLKLDEDYAYNFVIGTLSHVLNRYERNHKQIVQNGLAACAMEVINDMSQNVTDWNRVDKRVVFPGENTFLCSGSKTKSSKLGGNFLGNYITLLSKLVKLPMLEYPAVVRWERVSRTTISDHPACQSFKTRIPELKNGIDPRVANFLVLAFASGITQNDF